MLSVKFYRDLTSPSTWRATENQYWLAASNESTPNPDSCRWLCSVLSLNYWNVP